MCPVCMTTAVLIAGGVAATGGFATVTMKKPGVTDVASDHSTPTQSKEAVSRATA